MAQNEIQFHEFDCLWTDLRSGSVAFAHVAGTTSAINWDDDAAAILTAYEGIVAYAGNLGITKETNGLTPEWINGLANTDIDLATVSSNTLKQDASAISVTNDQDGIADVSVTPSNSLTTSAVAPVDEVQTVTIGGSNPGSFDLEGVTVTVSGIGGDATAIQNACDTAFGSGNTVVTGNDPYTITFQGALAGTPMSQIAITNDATLNGGVSSGTTTEGVTGIHQQDTCTFSGTADAGSMTFDGQGLAYNADASTISLSGATASGTPASGSIVTTWSDYTTHTPFTVAANTLQITGQPQIIRVQLTASPTEGNLHVTVDVSTSADFAYSDSSPANITSCTGGGVAGNWTYTLNANASNVSASAAEGSSPLLKGVTVTPSTVQDGVAGGNRRRRLLLTRAG